MKKIIIIGILIIPVVVLAKDSGKEAVPSEPLNARNSVQENADIKIKLDSTVTPKGNRLLNIDISPSEELDEVEAFFLARSRVGINAALVGGSWPEIETSPGKFNYPGLKMANSVYKDVKVILELNPIETFIRTVPSDLETVPFDDPAMIARFKKLLDVVFSRLSDLQITALWIGNEVPAYLAESGQWKAYQTFYETVGAYAKTIRPGIKVGTGGTFDGLMQICPDQMKSLNRSSDIIVSTFWGGTSGNVKNDFAALTSEFPGRTIYIKEIGCPTSSRVGSSQEKQKEFVKEVFRAWDEHASQIEYLSFHPLHDIPKEYITGIMELMGKSQDEDTLLNMEIMTSFGLRTYPGKGEDKPAFRELIRQARARGWGAVAGDKADEGEKYAYIGQFIFGGQQDVEDFIEKTAGTPPIVFFGVDWVNDEDLFADPKNPAPVSPIEKDVIDFLNRLSEMGTIPAIVWSIPVPMWDMDSDKTHLVPNIPRILSGEFDDYIRTVARQLKEYGKPIMLTFLGEFNNLGQLSFGAKGFEMPEFEDVKDLVGKYGDPKWLDGPERVRDAFIHVIDIFRQEGANNISWFMYGSTDWLVKNMTDDEGHTEWWSHPKYYYPGDEYIDWVGKSVHFTTFAEFKNRFESAYDAWGEVTQNPFFIPEFNFAEKDKSRSTLMKQVFLDYLPTKPRFRAATFMHSPALLQVGIDWGLPLAGTKGEFPDEIQTWKEVVIKNPYYRSRLVIDRSQ